MSFFRRHEAALLAVGAIAGSWLAATLLPVYFRSDDASYLTWAASHDASAVLVPAEARIVGMYRPEQNVVWLALCRYGSRSHPRRRNGGSHALRRLVCCVLLMRHISVPIS